MSTRAAAVDGIHAPMPSVATPLGEVACANCTVSDGTVAGGVRSESRMTVVDDGACRSGGGEQARHDREGHGRPLEIDAEHGGSFPGGGFGSGQWVSPEEVPELGCRLEAGRVVVLVCVLVLEPFEQGEAEQGAAGACARRGPAQGGGVRARDDAEVAAVEPERRNLSPQDRSDQRLRRAVRTG